MKQNFVYNHKETIPTKFSENQKLENFKNDYVFLEVFIRIFYAVVCVSKTMYWVLVG